MSSDDDAFEHRTNAFLRWFDQQPGAILHPSLHLDDLRHRNAGRGIIAQEKIEADAELFRIPRKNVLTSENSSLVEQHPTFFEDVDANRSALFPNEVNGTASQHDDLNEYVLDPWLRLIVTLIFEVLQGESSPWKAYLDVLPSHFDTPMFWSDDELAELEASDLRDRVGKIEADMMFRSKLVPLVRSRPDVFKTSMMDDELLVLAHRMGSTIMAYAFGLQQNDEDEDDGGEDGWIEDREGQMLGMVPMADMLNADAEFNAHLNHDEDALTMVSLRPIAAGEEVLNYYGPLPNSDLLRRYGYVSAKHDVHNVVELPWPLLLDAVKLHLKLSETDLEKAVSKLNEDEVEDSFVFEYASVSPDATGALPRTEQQVLDLPEALAAQLKALLKQLRRIKPGFESSPEDIWTIIKLALESRAAKYVTTIEEDERILRNDGLNIGDAAMLRKFMAVKVRLGEKQLLASAQAFVHDNLHPSADEPPRKRAKVV